LLQPHLRAKLVDLRDREVETTGGRPYIRHSAPSSAKHASICPSNVATRPASASSSKSAYTSATLARPRPATRRRLRAAVKSPSRAASDPPTASSAPDEGAVLISSRRSCGISPSTKSPFG